MTVSENELSFANKQSLEPGYYDKILTTEHMLKEVSPYHIKTSIYNCYACQLRKYCKPLELGNFNASVMVIGETPSDVQFETEEGKLLAETLKWAGFEMDDVYFTAISKCEETPTPERCFNHLLSEIQCVQPQIIISLGYNVAKMLAGDQVQPGFQSDIMKQFTMLTTYRLIHIINSKEHFQYFCQQVHQAKHYINQ